MKNKLVIIDEQTNLMWVKDGNSAGCNNGEPLTWKEAVKFCKKLNYAGFTDWRLPTIKELQSIVDYERHNTAIFENLMLVSYWSSTTNANTTDDAWEVTSNGSVHNYNKAFTNYVRPVRTLKEEEK